MNTVSVYLLCFWTLYRTFCLKRQFPLSFLKIRKHSYTSTLKGLYIKWTLFLRRFVTSFYEIPIWCNVIFPLCVTALINLVHLSVSKFRKPGKLEALDHIGL